MSIESVKEFYKLLESNTTLQKRVKAAENSATVVQIASENGCNFTEQELEKAMQESLIKGELSEQELETVAGGAVLADRVKQKTKVKR